MNNVIVKTALKTLLAVIIALVVALAVLCLGFPQTVAGIFENSGNYSMAIPFASLRYTYTGSAEDLAKCAEDSIFAGDNRSVTVFCGELTKREDFPDICTKKDESVSQGYYRRYIYANYAYSLYLCGNADEALKAADEGVSGEEGFPLGNAYAKLAIAVAEAKDGQTALKLLERLNGITPEESEKNYLDKTKKVISDIGV